VSVERLSKAREVSARTPVGEPDGPARLREGDPAVEHPELPVETTPRRLPEPWWPCSGAGRHSVPPGPGERQPMR